MAEFGTPEDLLQSDDDSGGFFRALVDGTGEESAALLRGMVRSSRQKQK